LNLQPPVLETGALPIELRPSVAGGLYRRSSGINRGVSEPGNDNPETSRQAEDDLLQQQEEEKVYGDDEGKRDDAFADEDEQ
jgi:hypothetical protein